MLPQRHPNAVPGVHARTSQQDRTLEPATYGVKSVAYIFTLAAMLVLILPASLLIAAPAHADDATIAVQDQRIEGGNIVRVDTITTPADGFVAIHVAGDGDKPGQAIGHAIVDAGSNSNVSVKLEQDVKSGDKLLAVLHEDSAADGMFDDAADKPLAAPDGKLVMATFVAQ